MATPGTSDDSALTEQILSTHSHYVRLVDVKPILRMIDDVLRHIIPLKIDHALNGRLEHMYAAFDGCTSSFAVNGVLDDALAHTVHKICCEISCKCSSGGGGGDAHATTMAILNMLSSYSWDAKVVLTLTAFAVDFGELWLIVQLRSTNSLAAFVALLKQLPDILEHSHTLKPHFDALKKLISAMIDVTEFIVKFYELPTEYISSNVPPMSIAMTHVPTAAYWIIRNIVACSAQITYLIGSRHEFIRATSEACELSSLADKVSSIHKRLQNQLHICHQHIVEKKLIEAFEDLKRTIETPQIDNLKILIKIFGEEDPQPLFCPEKTKVHVEVLKRNHLLLLISDLDISVEEIRVLQGLYKDRVTSKVKYEILWLPVLVDRSAWNETDKGKFLRLQEIMPWYTANPLSTIEPAFLKYAREIWGFVKKPIGVTLDPQGKVLCPNALNMMRIWGNQAFPFSNEKEESLWKVESWRIELLIADLEPNLPTWLEEQKVVCFYGGEKMEWIESFIESTTGVADCLSIGLEMVYVGKNNARERVKEITASIKEKQLSHTWQDDTVWFFWNRLVSMLSKPQNRKINGETSVIKQEVRAMLGYDGSEDGGWAVFFSGSTEMVRGNGRHLLNSLQKFEDWEKLAREMGFLPALSKHMKEYPVDHHCVRLILPEISGEIEDKVVCAECGLPMELYFMYKCCVK